MTKRKVSYPHEKHKGHILVPKRGSQGILGTWISLLDGSRWSWNFALGWFNQSPLDKV
jgi:hypothetical protein